MSERIITYPPFPADSHKDLEEIAQNKSAKRAETWHRFTNTVRKIGASVLLASTIVTGQSYAYIQRDINEGKAEVAGSHPRIHPIFLTTDPEMKQVATFVATGLGTRNPSETANILTAHHEVGNVFAVEYSNRDININELTESIVESAQQHDIKYLSFDGYSMGGPIEMAIAAQIYENYDDLHVLAVTLHSSPIGSNGLTAKSEEGVRILSMVLNRWPDLAYSKKARIAAEVLGRHEQYFDPISRSVNQEKIEQVIADVKREKIINKNVASGSLMQSQIEVRYRYGVQKSQVTLSQPQKNKQPPFIIYTRSSDPHQDTVVNTTASADNLEKIIDNHFIPHTVIDIDNIGHANPAERPVEYNHAITNHINPILLSILRIDHGVGGQPEYGNSLWAEPKQSLPRLGHSVIFNSKIIPSAPGSPVE